jgi:ectoine hydroxylase-related dioxygenase (phytanoyl-CoA dioxygenase family)
MNELATSLDRNGFAFIPGLFDAVRREAIINGIAARSASPLRSLDTYAIRRVMQRMPELAAFVWNPAMQELVRTLVGDRAFITKSIWFDKPPGGNWFVGYHQDISISVDRKVEVEGYSRWTAKQGIIGVVPPVHVLENTLTLRIHLDDADATNGALQVKQGTHRNGILRSTDVAANEVECSLRAGDVMVMRPLLLHASMRSTTTKPRRVLHIEVSRQELAAPLQWAERMAIA